MFFMHKLDLRTLGFTAQSGKPRSKLTSLPASQNNF
jgi:hypothetical protein